MRYPSCSFLGAALGFFIHVPHSQAALSAYEGFAYADPGGTSLAGLNGGTGWDEAFPTPVGTIDLQPGLTFGAIGSAGDQAGRFNIGANFQTGRDWEDASSPLATGSTYYYSFLVHPTNTVTNNARGTIMIMRSTASGDSQNGFGLRIDNNGTSPQFKAWSPAQAAGANLDFSAGYNQTYLVVGKITIDSAGTSVNALSVYNAAAGIPSSEPVTFASSIASIWTGNADTLRPTFGGRAFSNSAPYGVDEIRIGTTFADVIPVPEPASGVFALLSMLGLVLRRRR
jgi:MYXO-CTERM domain-containing protein